MIIGFIKLEKCSKKYKVSDYYEGENKNCFLSNLFYLI